MAAMNGTTGETNEVGATVEPPEASDRLERKRRRKQPHPLLVINVKKVVPSIFKPPVQKRSRPELGPSSPRPDNRLEETTLETDGIFGLPAVDAPCTPMTEEHRAKNRRLTEEQRERKVKLTKEGRAALTAVQRVWRNERDKARIRAVRMAKQRALENDHGKESMIDGCLPKEQRVSDADRKNERIFAVNYPEAKCVSAVDHEKEGTFMALTEKQGIRTNDEQQLIRLKYRRRNELLGDDPLNNEECIGSNELTRDDPWTVEEHCIIKNELPTDDPLTEKQDCIIKYELPTDDPLTEEECVIKDKLPTDDPLTEERQCILKYEPPIDDPLTEEECIIEYEPPTDDPLTEEECIIEYEPPTDDPLAVEEQCILKYEPLTDDPLAEERCIIRDELQRDDPLSEEQRAWRNECERACAAVTRAAMKEVQRIENDLEYDPLSYEEMVQRMENDPEYDPLSDGEESHANRWELKRIQKERLLFGETPLEIELRARRAELKRRQLAANGGTAPERLTEEQRLQKYSVRRGNRRSRAVSALSEEQRQRIIDGRRAYRARILAELTEKARQKRRNFVQGYLAKRAQNQSFNDTKCDEDINGRKSDSEDDDGQRKKTRKEGVKNSLFGHIPEESSPYEGQMYLFQELTEDCVELQNMKEEGTGVFCHWGAYSYADEATSVRVAARRLLDGVFTTAALTACSMAGIKKRPALHPKGTKAIIEQTMLWQATKNMTPKRTPTEIRGAMTHLLTEYRTLNREEPGKIETMGDTEQTVNTKERGKKQEKRTGHESSDSAQSDSLDDNVVKRHLNFNTGGIKGTWFGHIRIGAIHYEGQMYQFEKKTTDCVELLDVDGCGTGVFCHRDAYRIADKRTSVTAAVRRLLDGVFTTEALASCTVSGQIKRGQGKANSSKVTSVLDPKGTRAIIEQALLWQETKNMTPKRTPEAIRIALRCRVSDYRVLSAKEENVEETVKANMNI